MYKNLFIIGNEFYICHCIKYLFTLACIIFTLPVFSQVSTLIPDSVWETPKKVILYGKEQSEKNRIYIIKEIEKDNRFCSLNIEAKYNFYDQVQLGLGKTGNMPDCITYMKKCIQIAIDNNREELLYSSNGDNYIYSQYYWLNTYASIKGTTLNYEDFFDTMMNHIEGVKKVFGINSKEFLIALLSPYINCNYRSYVENEHFGYIGNDSISSISPIVRQYIDASFEAEDNHQRYICLANAINNSTDSLSLAESYYEYSRYLLENNNIQDGMSLMISSIALRSRHLQDFFNSEHSLLMIATLAAYYYRIEEDKPEYYASYAMNKMLYELCSEMYPDSEFLVHRRADIISAATRLWLFNEADSLLTIEEKINQKDRRISNTYARALYYYKKGEAANDINIAVKSKKYFEKLKGTWHWNRFTTLQMLQEIYFETKDYKNLEKIQSHILSQTKEQAIDRILSVSSKERDYCLNAINSNTIYRFSTPKLLEQALDAAIFKKSLLTSAAIEIDKLARETNVGKDLLNKYRQAKYVSTENADYIERQLLSNCINPLKLKKLLDITVKDIKKQLTENDLFIDFEACDDSLVAIIITKKNGVRMIELCEFDRIRNSNSNKSDIDIIINTLSPIIEKYSAVYFVPAYSLYLMNIDIFFRRAFPNVEFHRISNLTQIKNHDIEINNIVAVGNPRYNDNPISSNSALIRGKVWAPLPGTGLEIREIDNVMRKEGNTTVSCYEGIDANEETIKSLDEKDVNVLHIATHGILIGEEDDDPEAALLLSGANADFETKPLTFGDNDGILLSSEIENLRFKNLRLVVLSACDSGIGSVNCNDGIKGLQRSFRIAGAQSMIVSLKKVDDEGTLNFMTDFYTKLSQTNNIYKSFVYAQDRSDDDTSNSFILIE